MNQKAQILLPVLLVAALVLATECQKKKAPEEEEKLPAMDRVARSTQPADSA